MPFISHTLTQIDFSYAFDQYTLGHPYRIMSLCLSSMKTNNSVLQYVKFINTQLMQ